jgi:hypothetical protein
MWEPRSLTPLCTSRPVTGIALPYTFYWKRIFRHVVGIFFKPVVLSSPDIFAGVQLKEDDMDGTCNDTHGEMINAHTFLVGKSKGKTPLGTR